MMSFDKSLNQDAVDAEIIKADTQRLAEAGKKELEAADGVRMASDKYNENRDLANQLLGQSQAFMAIRKIADVSALLKLRFVRENKLYRHIKTADGQPFSWKMYCDALHVSHKTVNEEILNLNVLGPGALESMRRMGISSRDLRKLRKAPEEDRQIIIESEAIDTGDKDAVRELFEDIVAKHAQEKEKAEAEQAALLDEKKAVEEVAAKRTEQVNELSEKLIRHTGRSMPWDDRIAPLKFEMTGISSVLDEAFGKLLIMHQAILGIDLDDDVRDVARRSLVTKYAEVLDRAAVLVAECQGKFDQELGGYIGAMREYLMQLPGEDLPTQEGDGPVARHPIESIDKKNGPRSIQ